MQVSLFIWSDVSDIKLCTACSFMYVFIPMNCNYALSSNAKLFLDRNGFILKNRNKVYSWYCGSFLSYRHIHVIVLPLKVKL